jgi:rare lipoprotein A
MCIMRRGWGQVAVRTQRTALGALLFTGTALTLAACATQPSPTPPRASGATLVGVASWYGPGFNGHRTASGAIYNQEAMTAASTLFPLGTRLRVTNLSNGRSAEVAVNDHGPYVKGRGLDLSHQAAHRLGMVGSGTAPVRMDVLYTPPGGPAVGQRYFVQVGSFANRAHARWLGDRLAARYSNVRVVETVAAGDRRYRVRLGAFADRREAELRAASLSRQGYTTKVVIE